jgi:preprotein translocase subunit SecE
MVIIVCFAVGIFLGALDLGFSELVAKVLLRGG